MSLRVLAALSLASCLALPAAGQDAAAAVTAVAGGPVLVSVNYSINVPLASTEPEAAAAADSSYRRALLLRAESECAELLASIATDCARTSITISTQVNSYPGQPPALYVNSSETLQITLRKAPAAP
jgi:hypothetical protein